MPALPRPEPAAAATRRHELTLALAAGLGAVLVGAVVTRVGAPEGTAFDHRVRNALLRDGRPRLHRATHAALRAAGTAGTIGVYAPATALAAVAVARRRGRRQALPLGTAVAIATLAHWLVKHAVDRPRPARAAAIGNHKPSFPSGHTTRATAASLIVGYALARERVGPRGAIVPLAVALPAAVGASRVYGDVHWGTDVLGGWGLGAAVGAACALWYEHVRRETVA